VLEGNKPDDETAGVLGDGDPGITEGEEPDGENTGVFGNDDFPEPDGETTRVFGNDDDPSNDMGNTMDHDDQPNISESGSNESDSDDDEVHSEIADEDVYHPNTMTPSVQRTYGLRPRKPRDYSHIHAMVIHHATTQYSAKSGLRKFKEKGEKAVSQELLQLHTINTFAPQDSTKLTPGQKSAALESMMFLKEKRDGSIKWRAYAAGHKQRETATPGDAESPTVYVESVMITAEVEAHDGRDVAVVDAPGAFLSAYMDEEVLMTSRGRLAELMVKTASNIYRKYITLDSNNRPVLYVLLQNALYGCLRSALLFYKNLVKDLKRKSFKLNIYDPCVANKMARGKKFTMLWHVDDLKMSHMEYDEVTSIDWLKGIYGDMKVFRGKVHAYLGMTLDYSEKGEVKVTMMDYMNGVIEDPPEVITVVAATPATENLFEVRPDENRILLDEKRGQAFHHATAQLLFASSRARKDIQCTVAFLKTRVKTPDEDDWGKLKRLLRYIIGTIYMPLILKVDGLNIVQ
jgi:hypothetical protein